MPTEHIPDVAPPALLPLITLADFHAAGLAALLAGQQDAGWDDLDPILRQAGAARVDGAGRALTLLADICSMMLVPEQPDLIYRPMIVFADGHCSLGPEHLSAEQLDVLAQVVDEIDQSALRARLADLLWHLQLRRDVKFARMAIEAYRRRPVQFDTWHGGAGGDCAGYHRALQLAKQIRAEEGRNGIARVLVDAFFRAAYDSDGYAPLAFLKPLWAERRADGREREIAIKLEELGHAYFGTLSAFNAESYFSAAANWYRWARESDKHEDMLAMVARSIALQAGIADGAMVQHHWLTKAIEAYRQVPARARKRLNVAAAIEALRRQRETAGHAMLGEMKVVEGPRIPIADIAEAAAGHVKGRNPLAALLAFCGVSGVSSATALRAEAERSLRESPISAMFSGTVVAEDGRQVANTGPDAGWDAQVAEKARWLFRLHAGYVATGAIIPALDQIQNERAYRLADFVAIAERSPIVPVDRASMIGKGLHAGFNGDMVQAMHILMPQFEHLVRQVLQGAGALTAQHDRNGLDMEVGLSALLDRPQMVEQFGEDLQLAIHSLMCDPAGPNLRNAIAHGLADEGLCGSALAYYAWWLILRVVVKTFAAAQKASNAAAVAQAVPSTPPADEAGW